MFDRNDNYLTIVIWCDLTWCERRSAEVAVVAANPFVVPIRIDPDLAMSGC